MLGSGIARGPLGAIAEAWQEHASHERTAPVVAEVLGLQVVDVEAALNYWADYREEIDNFLQRHIDESDAALAAWNRRQALV